MRAHAKINMKINHLIIALFFVLMACNCSAGKLEQPIQGGPAKSGGSAVDATFKIAIVGDIQVPDDNAYALSSAVFDDLASRKDIDAAFFLGDLVMENSSLLEKIAKRFSTWKFPVYIVPGNHDRDGKVMGQRSLDSWKKLFGEPDRVVYVKGVKFILMNDVRTGKERSGKDYVGGLNKAQKKWLKEELAKPYEGRSFLMTHVPFSSCYGADSLSSIISGHESMLLANAHTHVCSRGFWSGFETLDAGAPYAMTWMEDKRSDLMNCGAPRGYYIATVNPSAADDSWLEMEFHSVVKESPAPVYVEQKDGRLVVNVFGGAPDACIYVSCKPLTYQPMLDPRIERMRKDSSCKVPAGNKKSKHIWVLNKSGLQKGDEVEVFYSDRHMKFKQKVTVH